MAKRGNQGAADMPNRDVAKVPDGHQMHTLIHLLIIIDQLICMHRLCTPAIVPGGKCIYLLDYLQFDPLTSLPSTHASARNQFQSHSCFNTVLYPRLRVICTNWT
jgi:hypothetical protein